MKNQQPVNNTVGDSAGRKVTSAVKNQNAASSNPLANIPIIGKLFGGNNQFTPDGKREVGLRWDPSVLLTGKEISFFVTFFDRTNNNCYHIHQIS
jgi:hypothetical protein